MALLRPNPLAFADGTSAQFTTPYAHQKGTFARDADGNEYVLCSVGSNTNLAPEMCVAIASDYTISALGATGRGSVGVIADYGKSGLTSAYTSPFAASTLVWVQIYGRAFVQCSTGGDSSPSESITTLQTTAQTQFYAPTSGVTTPVGALLTSTINGLTTVAKYFIRGMTVATDVTVGDVSAVTLVSATHSGARAAVWLNYPEIRQHGGFTSNA